MKLSQLLKEIAVKSITDQNGNAAMLQDGPEIGSIHYRSDHVRPGGLFIALKGFQTDGHDYIEDAVRRGAAAILVEKAVSRKAFIVEVENTRTVMGPIAARFHGNPAQNLCLIGVTGTNGKTTITFIVERILEQAGIQTGVIGTINYRYAGKIFANPMTTPESIDLQRILAEMAACGVTHVVMEVSSHAIDLHRVAGCLFDITVFSNLSQDHLDFHKSMAAYWECKQKLFHRYLKAGAAAVINTDDPRGQELRESLTVSMGNDRLVTVGTIEKATVSARQTDMQLSGITTQLTTPEENIRLHSNLVGNFNLENILCAAGIAFALKLPASSIKSGIESFEAVPGRLEKINNAKERYIFVDYAHTPDALEKILATLRRLTGGRMITVFGCGGDRDRSKRPLMGEISAQYADISVVTSDNPRTEDPDQIITDICTGLDRKNVKRWQTEQLPTTASDSQTLGKGYMVEPDRRRAIQTGLKLSQAGDTIVIAGKGHETYQILKTKTIAFDDRLEARTAVDTL